MSDTARTSSCTARALRPAAALLGALAFAGSLTACSSGNELKTDEDFYGAAFDFIVAYHGADASTIKDLACEGSDLYQQADAGDLEESDAAPSTSLDDHRKSIERQKLKQGVAQTIYVGMRPAEDDPHYTSSSDYYRVFFQPADEKGKTYCIYEFTTPEDWAQYMRGFNF